MQKSTLFRLFFKSHQSNHKCLKNNENAHTANIVMLKTLRERRFYLELARADAHWQETTASFKLEGFHATKEDAERAGRVIAGVWTLEQAIEYVRRIYLARFTD